ncbi:uncharacterized protein LOC131598781 [Vicia villosa]|uniref:uncharacterized protein LOC131598781 n=1 Tax=Vicia villosa TaxID=3911 RepID=UPI00273C14D8|nr:uncharacterized protein LOC131598781 [Vicia villosa]
MKISDSSKSGYEALRNARISENKARFESLGILNSVSELRQISTKKKRPWVKKDYSLNPLRRSQRIKAVADGTTNNLPPRKYEDAEHFLPEESRARRCRNKRRGSVLSSILGISCHFCRQKKLCGEDDCKRCGNCDVNEPCLGNTDCSVCHSTRGVFCRDCLKVRYGEELEEVRENKEWTCPHCIEEKGINPY